MNNYKIVGLTNGMVINIYVTSNNIAEAAYATGIPIGDIIKIELIDSSQNINDYRTDQ